MQLQSSIILVLLNTVKLTLPNISFLGLQLITGAKSNKTYKLICVFFFDERFNACWNTGHITMTTNHINTSVPCMII